MSAQNTDTPDGEDVNDFLRRIKELGEKRDQEDAERTRKLEEEILEGRRQREARRAERARSLSPEKQNLPATSQTVRPTILPTANDTVSGPPTTYTSANTQVARHESPSRVDMRASASSMSERDKARGSPSPAPQHASASSYSHAAPLKPSSPKPSSPSAAMPGRAGSVRGQRPLSSRPGASRPTSMISMSRPQSAVAPSSPLGAQKDTEQVQEQSRDDITKSLEGRDPSWFRQTADRGVGSAAYRRSQEERPSSRDESSERRQLHGLVNRPSAEPEDLRRSIHEQRLTSPPAPVSPIVPLKNSQKLDPPSQNDAPAGSESDDHAAPRPAFGSGRRSPDRASRSISPTKGMGGFVQSAMLRRNDSVSKRWSAQAGTGLMRSESHAERSPTRIEAKEKIKPSNSAPKFGVPSDIANSGQAPQPSVEPEPPSAEAIADSARPASRHSRSRSAIDTPPASPSKRWSPNKSSWLESALIQPEQSNEIRPAVSKQPAWMAELAKKRMSKDINAADLPAPPELSSRDTQTPSLDMDEQSADRSDSKRSLESGDRFPDQRPKPGRLFDEAPSTSKGISQASQAIGRSEEKNAWDRPLDAAAPTFRDESSARNKPSTPPKKDFRSSLKSAPAKNDKNEPEGLEFRNALGSLKRATTEKYEAPDVLKNNILRGKAGLAITGGPQKSERKDEFKDSLIQQKTAMKEKAAEVKPNATRPAKEPEVIPEALARRKTLGRQDRPTSIHGLKKPSIDVSADDRGTKDDKATAVLANKPSAPVAGLRQGLKPTGNKLADRFNPGLAGMLARGPRPPPEASKSPSEHVDEAATHASPPDVRDSAAEPSASRSLDHMTKGRAKGPKRRVPKGTSASTAVADDSKEPSKRVVDAPSSSPAKAPVDAFRPSTSTVRSSLTKTKPVSPISARRSENTMGKDTASSSSLPSKPMPPSSSKRVVTPQSTQAVKEASREPKREQNNTALNSATSPSRQSSRPIVQQSNQAASKPDSVMDTQPAAAKTDTPHAAAKSTEKQDADGQSKVVHQMPAKPDPPPATGSVKTATARWGQLSSNTNPAPRKEPAKSSTQAVENGQKPPSFKETPPTPQKGLGLTTKSSLAGSASSGIAESPSNALSPRNTAVEAVTRDELAETDPRRSVSGASFKSFQSEGKSDVPQTTEAQRHFTDFFGECPISPTKLEIDTAAILAAPSQSSNGKIKTLRKTILEITGDGKTHPVASHQDNMLFSESMYLCTHIFGDSKGARLTEVYLWLGSRISESTAEDVQIFAKKAAREANGTLVTFRQGKETSNFFQALGGIVISRKGTSSSSVNQPYMLCGRRHLGHIAFDEVPLALSSFSSAFPFIICPSPGKLFIWKGRGAHSEEVTCAKIIAMDLAPAAEVKDLEERSEPPNFLTHFPDPISPATGKPIPKALPRSAEHWKLKPSYDKYRPRLFSVETSPEFMTGLAGTVSGMWSAMTRRPSTPTTPTPRISVREIEPFTQADLESEGIYVLDAFFEIYVLPGPLAQKQSSLFAAALLFAQDYGIMAAGREDRPYVPVGIVVMEGVPRDMKAAFRGWDDAARTAELGGGKRKGD